MNVLAGCVAAATPLALWVTSNDEAHPAIIDTEVFDAARALLRRRVVVPAANTRSTVFATSTF